MPDSLTPGRRAGPRPVGRPFQFVEDLTPIESIAGGEAVRFAWLLASTRLHGPQPFSRTTFVRALRDSGRSGDAARISRWESGASAPPVGAVLEYEKMAGAPRCSLLTVGRALDVLRQRRSLPSTPGELAAAIDPYFDQLHHDRCSGEDWENLATVLVANETLYVPARLRRDLTRTLLTETIRSFGHEYDSRRLAARNLTSSPMYGPHVTRFVSAMVADGIASADQLLDLLPSEGGAKRAAFLLGLLGHPDPRLRSAACRSLAVLLATRMLPQPQVERLEQCLTQLLHEPQCDLVAVADAAARLPDEAWTRVAKTVRGAKRRVLTQVASAGEVTTKDQACSISNAAADSTESATIVEGDSEPDLMLRRLIREALFHGHSARRHQSSILLAASPYAPALAETLIDMLSTLAPGTQVQALHVLRYLAPSVDADRLLGTSPSTAIPRVHAALIGVIGASATGLSSEARAMVRAALASEHPLIDSTAVEAAGLIGGDLLDEAERRCEENAAAVRWWREAGPAIHPS